MTTRFDYVFSYWLFTWYILYELKIIRYNPKLGLSIGLIVNLIELIIMFYYNYNNYYIILFIVINSIIKLIPLWRLKDINYKKQDIDILLFIFIIYIIWLLYNNININHITTIDDIKNNKPFTPLIYLLNKNENIIIK
jgi:hypothetical protein